MFSRQSAFTIVELLIVIVVIAILASISIVSYTGIQGRAAATVLQSDLRNAATQLTLDYTFNGTYPLTKETANEGKGLPNSTGTTYNYTSDGTSFCLTASSSRSGVSAYYVSNTEGIVKGECPSNTVPSGVTVAKITYGWNVTWGAISGATSYTVQTSWDTSFSSIEESASTSVASIQGHCFWPGGGYVRVASHGTWGQSAWSSPAQITAPGPPPVCPP